MPHLPHQTHIHANGRSKRNFLSSLFFSFIFFTSYSNASQCQPAMCHIFMHRIGLIKASFGLFSIILFMVFLTLHKNTFLSSRKHGKPYVLVWQKQVIFFFSRLLKYFLFIFHESNLWRKSISPLSLYANTYNALADPTWTSGLISYFSVHFSPFFRRSWDHVRVAEIILTSYLSNREKKNIPKKEEEV